MKRNTAGQVIGVQMVSATDGSAFTGTVACLVTVDGGAQGAGGGSVVHEGNGFHSYTPTQGETDGAHVAFTFTGTGAVPATVQVYPSFPQTIDAATLPTAVENADTLLDRNMATGADNGSATVRTVRQALRFLRNKWSISGTTLTVTKEDDTAASWTTELTTNAAAEPVTGSDPASS